MKEKRGPDWPIFKKNLISILLTTSPKSLSFSVTRLGDNFWNFLSTNSLTKVAPNIVWLFVLKNIPFLKKTAGLLFWQLLDKFGYLSFQHLVTLRVYLLLRLSSYFLSLHLIPFYMRVKAFRAYLLRSKWSHKQQTF